MSVNLSQLSHEVKQLLSAAGIPVPLGHAMQLAASAFGYRTLAAFQQEQPPQPTFGLSTHLVFDTDRVLAQARGLQPGADPNAVLEAVLGAFRKLLSASRVHLDEESLNKVVRDLIERVVLNDENVTSQMAMTNGSLGEVHFPVDIELDQIAVDQDDDFELAISGHVRINQDLDKPFTGDTIPVELTLSFRKIAPAAIAGLTVTVTEARLLWGGGDESERPIAELLAEELGIDVEDAELVEYDAVEDVGSDDMVYGYILYFEKRTPPEILEKIRRNHPELSIRVPLNFFGEVAD